MSIRSFFSNQARNPTGLFGRWIMARVFDQGNAILNGFMNDLLDLQTDDHVLEIGFGTGRLICVMAKQTSSGLIEGIDFSSEMVEIAKRNNQENIAEGSVRIALGDFDQVEYQDNDFDKICSANTIYFWPDPQYTASKIHRILKPGGKLVLGFGDKTHLETRSHDPIVFRIYAKGEVEQLLTRVGFDKVEIKSRGMASDTVHCAIATKKVARRIPQ